jgi:nitronate monooxygenase
MRNAAVKENDIERMQAWAGQSAGLAKALPAAEIVRSLWDDAQELLS